LGMVFNGWIIWPYSIQGGFNWITPFNYDAQSIKGSGLFLI
jgi:hypothetical protein